MTASSARSHWRTNVDVPLGREGSARQPGKTTGSRSTRISGDSLISGRKISVRTHHEERDGETCPARSFSRARDGSSSRRRDRATNPIVVPCAGGDSFRPAFAPSIVPLPAGSPHRVNVRCAIDVSPTTCLSRREQADFPAGHSLSRTGTRGQQAPLAPSSRWRRSPISEKGRRPGGEEPAARDRQGQSDRDGLADGIRDRDGVYRGFVVDWIRHHPSDNRTAGEGTRSRGFATAILPIRSVVYPI
jgi:hypothetical protein